MLSRNILIFSAVVFLAPIVSAAPIEEKEPDETELEVETGEELSEEEDDEDDSQMQDMHMGTGAQKATAAPGDAGTPSHHDASFEGDSSNGKGSKVNGGSPTHTGHDSMSSSTSATGGTEGGNGREPHVQPSSSHDPSAEVPIGSSMETGFAGAGDHGSSMSQVLSPGAVDAPSETIYHDSGTQMGSSSGINSEVPPQSYQTASDHHQSTSLMDTVVDPGVSDPGSQIAAPESAGYEATDAEFNGNGQKLLVNGAHEGPLGTDHIADGAAQTHLAGPVDPSSIDPHADLLGLADLFLHDIHTAVSDHTGSSSQIASTDLGLDPGQSSSSGFHPDTAADLSGSSTYTEGGASNLVNTVQSDTQTDFTVPADPSGFDHPSLDSTSGGAISTFSDHSLAPGDTGFGTHDVHTSLLSDTTNEAVLSDMMSHLDHSHIDYPGAVDVPSTDSAATNGNGNGRQRPVTAIHQTVDHHGIDSQLDSTVVTGGVEGHTIIPQTDVMGQGSSHESVPHTDITDLGVEPVTSSHVQADITAPGDMLSTSVLDTAGLGGEALATGYTNSTELFPGAGLEAGSTDSANLQGEHIETAVPGDALNTMSQTDGVGMVTADPQGVNDGLSQTGITPQAQPAACSFQLPQLNSTSPLVRVLKVQKMWNWRIPADFHIKPRVRILRYRFQCMNQPTWKSSEPAH
ncbi:uncharacterized protein LOC118232865 isoform X6 [Anguilla anguilla]|uniref:uncharacterized protein LOC118232865 isoform X6 n=1 Tax=Anguilla anguilla TaxID=7936 RepID=UPI0015A86BCC|nr:uncharacterized protein LOC118232865 isoform X6 [Anguilla anguilla]